MEELWLTTKEVAKLLKVHENTVLRYAQVGYRGVRLASVRVGKCLRYTPDAVETFLRTCNPEVRIPTVRLDVSNIKFCPKTIGGRTSRK